MPYYKITIHTKDGKIHSGIRFMESQDIDNAWRQARGKAEQHYGRDLNDFSLVMMSKLSREVQELIRNQGKKEEIPLGGWQQQKSRKSGYGKDLNWGKKHQE